MLKLGILRGIIRKIIKTNCHNLNEPSREVYSPFMSPSSGRHCYWLKNLTPIQKSYTKLPPLNKRLPISSS